MVSQPKGVMYVPVWIDDGVVKTLVTDAGTIPVTESAPLTSIQARLYVYDGGAWIPAPVGTADAISVHIRDTSADIPIAQASAALLQPGIHTHIGGSYQKQPMVWGYSDRMYEDLSESAPGTGTWTKLSTAVPAGEVHKLEFMYVINDTRAGASVTFSVVAGGVTNYFVYDTTVARYVPNVFVGSVTLKEGDHLRITMGGVTAGDVMKACVWGSKMDIDL